MFELMHKTVRTDSYRQQFMVLLFSCWIVIKSIIKFSLLPWCLQSLQLFNHLENDFFAIPILGYHFGSPFFWALEPCWRPGRFGCY